ncbi:MAG: twin-arginine translocase subunit TatB [Rhodobacteraceae bacterium]|nr:twin-arginine translocase subunit TatB [Paracoccaceae bacterium]
MFDLGWSELLIIGVVALIVVGPKDLPVMFRNIGRFVGKARGMAREFSNAMNEAADDAGVSDIQKTLKTATNPVGSAMDGVRDAAKDFKSSFDPTKLDATSETGKLATKRAEDTKKIQATTMRRAAEKKAAEAAEMLKKAEAAEADLAALQADTPPPESKT